MSIENKKINSENEKKGEVKVTYGRVYTKYEEAQDPDAFINAILDMRASIDNGGIDIINTKLVMYGSEFYLSTSELLHLALDEDFLKGAIKQENKKLEDLNETGTILIKELNTDDFNPMSRSKLWQVKANLQQIQDHKKKISSLKCKLHDKNSKEKDSLKIDFTEKFAKAIKEIRESIEERGLSVLVMDLKMKSVSFDVTPGELLHLALDRDCLQGEIDRVNILMSGELSKLANMKKRGIDIADDTITDVKKAKINLSNYNTQKGIMTSLMSDLHEPALSNGKENVDITLSPKSNGAKIFEKIRPATDAIRRK